MRLGRYSLELFGDPHLPIIERYRHPHTGRWYAVWLLDCIRIGRD